MSGEVKDALAVLFPPGSVVEVRAIADNAIHSGYFSNHKSLCERVDQLESLPEVQGIYVTLNEVDPALLSRRANRVKMHLGRKDATTSDGDILRRRWFPVDLDPIRPSGVSSTDDEHQAAIVRAAEIAAYLGREQGWPAPILADSGNGAHLLYRIDLPNDEHATALVKGCLEVLDVLFSTEAVTVDAANFNAARIWKLYGTTSRKGDNTPDRPHRKSRLLSVPEKIGVVQVEALEKLAGVLPKESPAGTSPQKRGAGIDLRDWLRSHGIGVRSEKPWQGGTLFVLEECPFSSAHRDGAFAIQFQNGAIFAGCQHASCGGGSQRWKELRKKFEPREATLRQKSETQPSPPPRPPPVEPEDSVIRERALEILRTGNPLEFMLDVFHREHVGDRIVAECLIMSAASQSVANTCGLHVAISGNSGKGKTHACNCLLALLPEAFRLKGTVSNKALFYHPIRPGTVLVFDDVTLSEDLQEVLKSATANFREPVEHRTLTSDRQVRTCTIPERCVWWLARVESPGDDQVMNRMLTVWIDDSTDQDQAVLTHMKAAAARGAAGESLDPDIEICRAMWEILKEKVVHVRIPFAPRIHFSATHNRRNPGMLFDLIRCHAILFCFQRPRDEHGSLVATREDFEYARRLFLDITGSSGGQETKQTKNEAAALDTIARMGWEYFTIKQLQEAMGLSYHQTYRLLLGYSNRKGSCQGILDKCPAVSYMDATVAGELYGVEVKRREHYFSFDPVLFRTWARNAEIWLEEETGDPEDEQDDGGDIHQGVGDPDVCTFAAVYSGVVNKIANEGSDYSDENGSLTERCTENTREDDHDLHQCSGAQNGPGDGMDCCSGFCVPGSDANVPRNEDVRGQLVKQKEGERSSVIASGNKRLQTSKSNRGVHPLPGLLDHREFVRVTVDLGRCDICKVERVMYQCKEKQVNVCEQCYARMVREGNEREGVY